MNILLTGGAGFIGSHTAVELLNAGHDVIIVDNLYNSSAKAVERVEELTGKRVKFYCADACDHDAMDRIFSENKVDAVIHFAAYKAVGESVAKPLEYYRNNLDCTLTVCEAMKKHGVKRFIFSSSATVYGIPDHMPLDETMPTSCTNPYGWTKYMNERILTDVAKANPDWSVVLLRYFNPIGAHESGRIGEMPNGIPNNLLPYVCGGQAGLSARVWRRLSDPGRNGRSRLYPCRRFGARPCRGGRLCHEAHRHGDHQSGHRPRIQRAGYRKSV